jgi:hypothetical protein
LKISSIIFFANDRFSGTRRSPTSTYGTQIEDAPEGYTPPFFKSFDRPMDEYEEYDRGVRLEKYQMAMRTFRSTRSLWRSRIPFFSSLSMEAQHCEMRIFEAILFGLHRRPPHLAFEGEELDDFCDALIIAWRLRPGCWIGLQRMIGYLTESTLQEDLCKIGEPALAVLKEIANNKHWPNNPMFGPMMVGQAKTLLASISGVAFHEATTPSMVRAMNSLPGTGQPHRNRKEFDLDRLRTCGNPACIEVEGEQKFKRCSRCRKVRYCSRDCQVIHWKAEHKQQCGK